MIVSLIVLAGCDRQPATRGEASDAGRDALIDPRCSECRQPWGSGIPGCTDVRIDPSNCGACDVACSSGVCSDSQCVAPTCGIACEGTAVCCGNGSCTNPNRDVANCGVCNHACGPVETCTYGQCACDSPHLVCGTACVDAAWDRDNCGGCGLACGAGTTGHCLLGICETCADVRQSDCGGTCADLQWSHEHCGACDHACGADAACILGACVAGNSTGCGTASCGITEVCCDGTAACTDPRWDEANCGGCGIACQIGEVCVLAVCVVPPPDSGGD